MKRSTILLPVSAAVLGAGAAAGAHAAPTHAKPRTFKGAMVHYQWGSIQVSIVVTGHKITNVKAAFTVNDPPSQGISGHAVAVLKSEVLKAQSAKIHIVSGATEISKAYIQSLKAAMKSAHLKP